MRHAKYEGEPCGQDPLSVVMEEPGPPEPLLISMEDLCRVLRSGKTTCFRLVGSGEIESVLVGRKRMPVWESVKAYVTRLRKQASTQMEAA